MNLISLVFGASQHNLCLLADSYRMAGFDAAPDDEGMLRTIPSENLSGVSAISEDPEGKRYSAASHIPQITLSELWTGEPKWPRNADSEEEEITNVENVVILGGAPPAESSEWNNGSGSSEYPISVGVDSTVGPLHLWKCDN